MRVRIHRGAEQIGGSSVEVEANGSRIIIDLGLPRIRRQIAAHVWLHRQVIQKPRESGGDIKGLQ
jgi:Cft2 family RNA processing exonuclease